MESVYITCLTNSSSSLYKNYHFHSHTTSESCRGTDRFSYTSVSPSGLSKTLCSWLTWKERKKIPTFLCVYLSARTYKVEFCEIWSRGHEPGKNPILMLCFGSKDYYHGFGYKLHIKDEWTTGLGRGLL